MGSLPRALSLAFHPHGEHVSPLLGLLSLGYVSVGYGHLGGIGRHQSLVVLAGVRPVRSAELFFNDIQCVAVCPLATSEIDFT